MKRRIKRMKILIGGINDVHNCESEKFETNAITLETLIHYATLDQCDYSRIP